MMRSRQQGVTLVELLVSMVIGLLIILSASLLYTTMSRTSRDIESLGHRQATGLFIADRLIQDIRHAQWVVIEGDGRRLQLGTGGDGWGYALDDGTHPKVGEDGRSVRLTADNQVIVSGLINDARAFHVEDAGGGLYRVTLQLRRVPGADTRPDVIILHVVNRAMAAQAMLDANEEAE